VGIGEYLTGCSGGYQFGSRFFGCHHVHGGVTFADAMMVSCDTYFYQVGLRIGIDVLADYARRFGCGQTTGIGLREGRGLIPDTSWYDRNYGQGRWGRGVVLNLSIGQGEVLTTPLQLAVMMAATGTGQVVRPHVVLRANGVEIPPPPAVPLGVPDEVRRLLVQSLVKVVEDSRGTGKRARVPGIRVAGKTGTAQNPHGDDHALFAAFAPASDPEVAIAVVVETIGHGGEFAAPIAGRVLQSYFGVEPPAGIPAIGRDPMVAD
jgi:penicillin-binding protein 2